MYIVRILGDETTIDLGRRGENRALAIDFPIDNFIANYGDGTPSLVHRGLEMLSRMFATR